MLSVALGIVVAAAAVWASIAVLLAWKDAPRGSGLPEVAEGEERAYRLYRDQIASEAGWVTTRTTWLLSANAFLATAFAILSVKGSSQAELTAGGKRMAELLPALGGIINVGTLVALIAAEVVTLRIWVAVRPRKVAKGEMRGRARLPHLLGSPMAHLIGIAVPVSFAVLMALGWWEVGSA